MNARRPARTHGPLLLAALTALLGTAALGADPAARPVSLGKLPRVEFQPARGDSLKVPVVLGVPGRLRLEVLTGDGDSVRVLEQKGVLKPGTHTLTWDGKDAKGTVVPDEAYHLVLQCECEGHGTLTLDARRTTGGHPVEKLATSFSREGGISYTLQEPARVLVRVGTKGGAMMRILQSWAPKAPGRVLEEWDGFDASGVEQLAGRPSTVVVVTGFTLPAQTVLATGNTALTYPRYRKERGWKFPDVDTKGLALQRDGRRLVKQSQLPASMLRDPGVTLVPVEPLARTKDGAFIVSGPVTFRVDIPSADDKWLLQQSLYEVSFFLDQQFVSEEETGYAPLTWRWTPSGGEPGRHTMTVNVSGFWGHVGVATVPVWFEKKK
jgi:hypothetical protein